MIPLCFFSILLLGIFLPKTKKWRSIYVFISACLLVLTMGFRHYTCFIDTVGYVQRYWSLSGMSFIDITYNIPKDVSFWYLSKIINGVSGGNYTIWLLILALSYVIPVSLLLKKYSNDLLYSYIIFFSLGFFAFSMTGLRQTLALSIIVISFIFLINGKLFSFVLLVILASLFHKTALIFLLAYPTTMVRFDKKIFYCYIIALFVLYGLGKVFLGYIVSLNIDDRFANYYDNLSGLNMSGLIQQIMIALFSMYFLRKKLEIPFYSILMHLTMIGILFQSLSFYIAEMFRISMYFSIFTIILFANAIKSIPHRGIKVFIPYSTLLVLVLYFVLTDNNCFYWVYNFYE